MNKLYFFPLLLTSVVIGLSGCSSGGDEAPATSGTNTAPVANAGVDQYVTTGGNPVILDGSGSSDADGNALGYTWALQSQPAGSSSFLSSATEVNPSFLPDLDGDYIVSLVVNDGIVDSFTDRALIRAWPVGSITAGEIKYDADCGSCHAAGTHDVTTKNNANDLFDKGETLITNLISLGGMNSVTNLTFQEMSDLYIFLEDPATNL